MKWLCLILTVLILAAMFINYVLVDQPIVSGMRLTAYTKVPVYAHLGGFVQTSALVIHILPSQELTSAKLADFLQDLAHSTPASPSGNNPFDVVSLTTGWTGQYSFTGDAWKKLGDMAGENDASKQATLLDQIRDASGQALVTPNGVLDPATQQAERDKVWARLVAYFTKQR